MGCFMSTLRMQPRWSMKREKLLRSPFVRMFFPAALVSIATLLRIKPLNWLEEGLPWGTMQPSILLQPEGNKASNIDIALEYAKAHPRRFRLSLQTHKFIGAR